MTPPSRLLLLVLAALLGAGSLQAQESARDVRVGHWVKVKGSFDGELFLAEELEFLAPDDEQAITGIVTRGKGPARFVLLGQDIHTSARTQLRGLELGDFTGLRVKVEGHYRGPMKFSARKITARSPGREALEGRVDEVRRTPQAVELRIMNYYVRVPLEAPVDLEGELAQLELAPEVQFQKDLRDRVDEDEIVSSLRLADDLYLGGQLEFESSNKENFDLDDGKRSDKDKFGGSLRAEVIWDPRDDFFLLVGVRTVLGVVHDQDDQDFTDQNTVLTEGFGYWRDLGGSGWDLQLGRQDFDERREWLYDQNLDGIRFVHSRAGRRIELSASTTLSAGSVRDEDTTNLMAYVSNNDLRRHAAAYVINRTADSSEQATHVGLRLNGAWAENQRSWLEAAGLFGESGGETAEAFGFDLGTTWSPEVRVDGFSMTLGYAYGSGDDDPTDGTDGAFRQTGLQDNNDKFAGVTSFRYYGELVDPELSNLGILTAGIGFRPSPRSSLDLVFHKFDQVESAPSLLHSDLRRKPDGVHGDIGWEADLVLGVREWSNWHLEIVAGYFRPGAAFPGADDAWLGRFQLRYKF